MKIKTKPLKQNYGMIEMNKQFNKVLVAFGLSSLSISALAHAERIEYTFDKNGTINLVCADSCDTEQEMMGLLEFYNRLPAPEQQYNIVPPKRCY
ncbi:MAG: hypothetical protein ACI8WB_000496 [Phenylobacterium sp.]